MFAYLTAFLLWIFSLLTFPQQDVDRCSGRAGVEPVLQVQSCSALIQSGRFKNKDLIFFYLQRSLAYSKLHDTGHELEDLDQAIAVDPNAAALAINDRCYQRAIFGQLQEALVDCNRALQILPNHPAILDSRGFTYLKSGDLDRAIADYDAALKVDPKEAHSLYGRGLVKQKKGDDAGASLDMEAAKAIQADIGDELARYGVK